MLRARSVADSARAGVSPLLRARPLHGSSLAAADLAAAASMVLHWQCNLPASQYTVSRTCSA